MSTTISGPSSMAPADHSRRRSMYPRRSNSVPPAPSSTTVGAAASNSVNFPNAPTSSACHGGVKRIRVFAMVVPEDELREIERQVLLADLVVVSDHAALQHEVLELHPCKHGVCVIHRILQTSSARRRADKGGAPASAEQTAFTAKSVRRRDPHFARSARAEGDCGAPRARHRAAAAAPADPLRVPRTAPRPNA